MALSCTSYPIEQSIKIEEHLESDDIYLWDILLVHAHDYLYKKNEYQISISTLLSLWNQRGSYKTEDQLKKALCRLGTRVTYKIKRSNKITRGFFVLLSWVYINNDICYYAYSNKFKELTHYPQIVSYLNQEGITCVQNTSYNQTPDTSSDNSSYYAKVLLRSYSLISQ